MEEIKRLPTKIYCGSLLSSRAGKWVEKLWVALVRFRQTPWKLICSPLQPTKHMLYFTTPPGHILKSMPFLAGKLQLWRRRHFDTKFQLEPSGFLIFPVYRFVSIGTDILEWISTIILNQCTRSSRVPRLDNVMMFFRDKHNWGLHN